MEENVLNSDIFAAMQKENPYKSYIKTVLGKLVVTVLNPFNDEPEIKFLKGNPKKTNERKGCIVHVWDEKGDAFFKSINEYHFNHKHLAEYTPPETPTKVVVEPEKPIEEWSDEELLLNVLNLKYAAFAPLVNKITSEAVLFKLLDLAKANDKTPRYIRDLKAKLADLQAGEYGGDEE